MDTKEHTIEKNIILHEKIEFVIAAVLDNLNVEIVTNVPGSGSQNILEHYNEITKQNLSISFHEEVAYTIAHGASLIGKRSACLIKSHGLVKAGNSIMDSLSSGTIGGFVTFVFSDKLGKHSDNIFDVVPFIKGLSLPFFTLEKDTIYQQIKEAYNYSEKHQLPVAVIIDDSILQEQISLLIPEKEDKEVIQYSRNVVQNLICPVFGAYQYQVLQAKLNEEDWKSIPLPNSPKVDNNLPAEWLPTIKQYQPVFDIFKNIRGNFVFGDTGISSLFGFEPYNCIDITTYMGGSLPLAIGALLSGEQNVWAVTGDFSFISTGYLGLIEAANRNLALKVLIFKNNIAQTTGGQAINKDLLNIQLKGFEKFTTYTKMDDSLASKFSNAANSDTLEIIVIEY